MHIKIQIRKKFILFKKRKKYHKLQGLKGNYDNITLKFMFKDGSFQILNTNPSFFLNANGQRLDVGTILKNINSIRHDLGANDYKILTE